MRIVDFKRKGNIVRFYLYAGDDDDYTGENWSERPYEQWDTSVYSNYIDGICDVAFPFDAIVCEPCDGHKFSRRSKNDMKNGRCPCIVAMMPETFDEDEYKWVYEDDFDRCASDARSVKFYFGNEMTPSNRMVAYKSTIK